MDFKQKLNNNIELINNELKKHIKKGDCPEKRLNEAKEYSLLAGGKRIRPMLMLSSYLLFDKEINNCLTFAIAMEMIHTFSLIHDDLPAIDNDDYRRGKLTNHKMFDEATAILAGDSLLNNAYTIISKDIINSNDIYKTRKIKALSEFSYGIDRMISGEYVDVEYEGKEIASQYLEYMHKNKTGALLISSIKIGAIISGASETQIEKLEQYGDRIGLAFQIKDDILSEIGDPNQMGKPVGNDREKGKCTYVTKYGLEESQKLLDKITKEAIDIISEFGENAEFLKELALYIKNRNK